MIEILPGRLSIAVDAADVARFEKLMRFWKFTPRVERLAGESLYDFQASGRERFEALANLLHWCFDVRT